MNPSGSSGLSDLLLMIDVAACVQLRSESGQTHRSGGDGGMGVGVGVDYTLGCNVGARGGGEGGLGGGGCLLLLPSVRIS